MTTAEYLYALKERLATVVERLAVLKDDDYTVIAQKCYPDGGAQQTEITSAREHVSEKLRGLVDEVMGSRRTSQAESCARCPMGP